MANDLQNKKPIRNETRNGAQDFYEIVRDIELGVVYIHRSDV
jgi:hypothetical protein